MKKILFVSLLLCLMYSNGIAKIEPYPLDERVAKSDLIIFGDLLSVSRYTEGDYDVAVGSLRITGIIAGKIRNRTGDRVGSGDSLKLITINSRHFACTVNYHVGSKGIWILDVENDGSVSAWFGGPLERRELPKVKRFLRKVDKKGLSVVELYAPETVPEIKKRAVAPRVVSVELVVEPARPWYRPDSHFNGLIRALLVFIVALILYRMLFRSRIKIKIEKKKAKKKKANE